jgi:hypothetical protein
MIIGTTVSPAKNRRPRATTPLVRPDFVALVKPEGTVFKTADGKVLIRPASPE